MHWCDLKAWSAMEVQLTDVKTNCKCTFKQSKGQFRRFRAFPFFGQGPWITEACLVNTLKNKMRDYSLRDCNFFFSSESTRLIYTYFFLCRVSFLLLPQAKPVAASFMLVQHFAHTPKPAIPCNILLNVFFLFTSNEQRDSFAFEFLVLMSETKT